MEALTRRQARALDRLATEELGLPGIVLMENAARGVAEVARGMLGGGRGPVEVTCGPGSNGGDGFAAARHLLAAGVETRVHLAAPEAAHPEGSDSGRNLRALRALGVPLGVAARFEEAALVIDALFGTGLARPLEGSWRALVARLAAAGVPVLSVDLPSGLDADTGEVLGAAVRASVTATMAAPKAGLLAGQGPAHAGRVVVVGLGFPAAIVERVRFSA